MNLTKEEQLKIDWIKTNLKTRNKWSKQDYSDFYFRDVTLMYEIIKRETTMRKLCNNHLFHPFLVTAGDSCVPIYHSICIVCRYDKTKKCFVPDNIWHDFILPQIDSKLKSLKLMHGPS